MSASADSGVRRLGTLVETVHAVVYFAPEPQQAYADLGLRGYWRGYFASRAAALGPVGPDLVTALFAGFAPAMVARAIPAVWAVADPGVVAVARLTSAAAAVRRLAVGLDDDVRVAGTLLARCVDALPTAGRPMAAAQRGLGRPDEPGAWLWHDCTVLREFRGDAHIAAVAAAGWRWPEPHLLQGTTVDRWQQEYRGWTDAEWSAAAARARGGSLAAVEDETDRLAAVAFAPLSADDRARLVTSLGRVAARCATALPYPNAMALAPL